MWACAEQAVWSGPAARPASPSGICLRGFTQGPGVCRTHTAEADEQSARRRSNQFAGRSSLDLQALEQGWSQVPQNPQVHGFSLAAVCFTHAHSRPAEEGLTRAQLYVGAVPSPHRLQACATVCFAQG